MSAGQEIFRAVKQARRYALEGNYETAGTFYSGLEQEIETYASTIQSPQTSSRWGEVRNKLNIERALLSDLQQELAALVNPAEAARRDRMLARGDAPQPTAGPAPMGGGLQSHSPPQHDPYAARDAKLVNHRPAAHAGGYGGPSMAMGFGGGGAQAPQRSAAAAQPPPTDWSSMDDYTAPVRNAVGQQRPTSNINEHLYGDKDRFGPAEGPAVAPTPMRRVDSSPRVVQSGARPAVRTPQTAPSREQREPPSTRAGGKVKPPLPKFGKRQGDPGPSGGHGDGSGGGPAGAKVPRFVPRPGEEELAALIEGDMYVGKLTVTFNDIAGQEEAKELLEEAVVYPILMPDYYQGIRRPWKGILMYGPPGTGKTMLAKAVASECGTTFFNISPATLTSKWRGEGEKLIRVLFDMARHYAPSTIFIDEIDSLCGQRGGGDEHEASRRAKGVLLTQMDGVGVDQGKVVMVLGATNHPWDIDEAMRRRLEKRIYIPLPTLADRVELFNINTKSLKLHSDVDFEKLSRILEDHYYSAADITTIARDAAMMTMRRFLSDENNKRDLKLRGPEIGKLAAEQPVSMDDFMNAIRKVPSSINVEQIKKFEEWKKEFETNI